jgi:hypothetical protein
MEVVVVGSGMVVRIGSDIVGIYHLDMLPYRLAAKSDVADLL